MYFDIFYFVHTFVNLLKDGFNNLVLSLALSSRSLHFPSAFRYGALNNSFVGRWKESASIIHFPRFDSS